MVSTTPHDLARVTCGTYGGRNKAGEPCGRWVISGTKRCNLHAGKRTDQARAEGVVILELERWGLDGHRTLRDAGEVMLRLVTQSAARVELYSGLLARAYDAAERLREARGEAEPFGWLPDDEPETPDAPAEDDGDGLMTSPAVQAAREDLRRVWATGGVGALIGVKRDVDRHGRLYDVEEAVRGLALLEASERDRCATFASKAIAAGLAERQVRLAEQESARLSVLLSSAVRGILDELGLSADQRDLVPDVVARHLRVASAALAGAEIEGEVVG